ncbi:MAG: pyridoxal-phosphate dependent enzyme [Flavobacteriales bacterium]|nr:pyridoxal-phosphate dependent enzyme [Flavobacteriales bacterium]
MSLPTKKELRKTADRIEPYVHRTPVLSSRSINDISGAEIYFKCENFQRMGAFKMRGATNAMLQLPLHEREKGVVTHSSGNFAQAVALAGKTLGVKTTIVMPEDAPSVKVKAVKGYGGKVLFCDANPQAREDKADEIVEKTGGTFLHPSDQMEVILGQGTAAIELLDDVPDLEYIMTPVGGGGLLAGTALAAHHYGKDCKVIAGEPREVNDAARSLKSGKIESNESTNTIADGLKTQLGENNFPIIQELVEDIIEVEEQEIIDAMKTIWQRMKIIIEPSAAVPFAALLKQKEKFQGKKIGIIISGGNVDLENLPF